MSLSSTVNRVDYVGAGSTEVFPYTFRIIAQTDLVVTVRDTTDPNAEDQTLTLTTHYTVSGVGEDSGGNVTLVNTGDEWLDADGDLDTGWALTVRRVRPLTQTTDIRNQGEFFPEVHEDAFDHFVMIAQAIDEVLDRCMKLPVTISGDVVSPTLPVPDAGKYLRWNDDEDGLENADVVSSTELGDIDIVSGDARGVVSITDAEDGFVIYTISEWFDLHFGSTEGTRIARGASTWGALAMPATETIAAAGTITANANGTVKRISSAGAVTTNTTNTFTAPSAANAGYIMHIVNVGSFNITLDRNANFKTDGGEDLVLEPGFAVTVASTGVGGFWYQLTPMSINS